MNHSKLSINDCFERDVRPQVGNVSELQGKRVGVDGNKILQILNDSILHNEPLAALTTSIPFPLYGVATQIAKLVELFKVEVVFNGIPIKRMPNDLQVRKPSESINLAGRDGDAIANFTEDRKRKIKEEIQTTLGEDGEDYLFNYLKFYDKPDSMTTTRAPFWAWAQLASYMDVTQKYLDDVYGCLELLAFEGVNRVITSIDRVTNTFTFYTKAQLVEYVRAASAGSLGFGATDLPALFAMYSNHRLFNELPESSFADIGRIVRCQANKLIDPSRPQTRFLARVVEFCPIMSLKGECVPLSSLRDVPSPNLEELFGERLPSVFYYAVMAGLLNPNTLGAVATLQVVDNRPLMDSTEYREISEKIIPLRAQVFHQLVLKLDEMRPGRPQQRGMTWIRRYNIGSGRQVPLNSPPPITLDEWDTTTYDYEKPPFFATVAPLANKACQNADYRTPNAALVSILLKSMDFMGYFTHAAQQPDTQDVSGPSIYSLAMECCTTASLSEYAVLLIELLRTNTLNGFPLKPPFQSTLSQDVLFASRLLSIVPITLKCAWSGPVSADLTAFCSMARMLQRSLRALTEVIATSTLAKTRSGNVTSFEFGSKIQPNLPFGTPLMCCSGVIVAYLMNCFLSHRPVSMPQLQAAFPDCYDLKQDLHTIFGFWYFAGNILMKLMEEEETYLYSAQLFQAANATLAGAAKHLSPEFSYLGSIYILNR